MDKLRKTSLLARLALLSAALIWGGSFVIMKNSVDVFPPHYLLAIRFTAAALLMAAVLCRRLKKIDWGYVWRGLVIGVCLFAAYSMQTLGLMGTTPGKNAFLTAIYCVIVPFLFWAVNKTRPDRYNIVAAVLCIAGVGLVSLSGSLSLSWGDGLTLLGGFFFAVHMIAVVALGKDRDPLLITLLQFVGMAACSWVVALCSEQFPVTGWSVQSISGLAFLVVFASCGSMSFQNFGQQHTPPAAAAILLSLESVFGVLISVICGEQLTIPIACGFVIIFAAVIISETKLSFLHREPPEDN